MPEANASENSRIEANWNRMSYGLRRGHDDYMTRAKRLEGIYLGGGRQWKTEDREEVEGNGRPAFEFNGVLPKINTAIGYQIANRMDIGFKPRGGMADQELATTMSKLAMQIADQNSLHWLETEVFADGLIQQRGYFELIMSYEDTALGEARLSVLDPFDVIPDPDAKSYDPDGWADVITTRWMTLDEIEKKYGKKVRSEVDARDDGEDDFGSDDGEERNSFGSSSEIEQAFGDGIKRVRVVDRQYWETDEDEVIITAAGDIRRVAAMSERRLQAMLEKGAVRTRRRMRKVRWTVSTRNVMLFDDWSPFQHFTVIPYFPFFRRGKSIGLVDNAEGPQMMVNKALSQFIHVVNTSANSGWISWENTLANMDEDELEERGSETGLHIQVKADTPRDKLPQKIQPNAVPQGIDRIIERAFMMLEQATGINEAMSGGQGREISGIAIQARQFASQQQLAVPLDNLARTRRMLAQRMLEIIQLFYDDERIIRITETDARGREVVQEIELNKPDPAGGVLNDVTAGEYDIVVAEVPMQVTFENSQFLQILEMIDKGAPIPWQFVLRYSNLAQKQELIDALEQQQQAQGQADPEIEAKIALLRAQTEKTLNEAVNKSVESQYSAMQAAGVIAATPATAPLADKLLKSAGYTDRDEAPIVPGMPGAPQVPGAPQGLGAVAPPAVDANTSPLTPANPGVGMRAGIETPAIDAMPVGT